MSDRYGKHPFPELYGEINELRRAIRAEGTPRIQDAWDKVEEHIDCAYSARPKEEEMTRGRDALDH